MKNGVCPKCKSPDILVFESNGDDKEKGRFADSEKIGMFDRVFTTRYVCCNCGYTERYFDGKDLEKLKKKYKHIRG